MKKILLGIIIMLFNYNVANAQDANGVIKTNPLGLFYSANITYEKPINDSGSAIVRLRYYYNRFNFTVNNVEKFAIPVGSVDIKLGYRFYLSKKHIAPIGFYVSPTTNILFRAGESNEFISTKKTIFAGGFHIGRQWLWGDFAFDIYGGVDSFFDTDTIIIPVGGLSIGFAL